MRNLLLAAAVISVAAIASPASAATVVYSTGTNIALTYQPVTGDYDGAFRFRVVNTTAGDPNGDFLAQFTFNSPVAGIGSAIASSVIVTGDFGSDVDFSGVFINGIAGSVQNGPASTAFVLDVPVTSGLNTLTFTGRLNPNGNRIGNGLVTGSLTLAAAAVVPEPASWTLTILGFGILGGALRRQSGAVRVKKASLRFA